LFVFSEAVLVLVIVLEKVVSFTLFDPRSSTSTALRAEYEHETPHFMGSRLQCIASIETRQLGA